MIKLLSSKYFLIISLIFVATTIAVTWLLFPGAITTFKSNKTESSALTEKLQISRAEGVKIAELIVAKDSVESLFQTATMALPTSPSPDLLLLQLDGLTKSLGLTATITVPFSAGPQTSQVTVLAPSTKDNNILTPPSTIGGSQPNTEPTTNNSPSSANITFTLAGDWDYPTALKLLAKLKTFIRWNTITSVDLAKTADKSTSTISGRVYWAPTNNASFSGSIKDFLNQAETLFSSYQSYTTAPDINQEGDFGKTNPFLP